MYAQCVQFLCTNMHAGQTAKEAKKPLASFQGEKNRVLHYCVRLAMLPFAAAVTQLPLSCHQSQQETYMHHTSDNWWSPSSQLLGNAARIWSLIKIDRSAFQALLTGLTFSAPEEHELVL